MKRLTDLVIFLIILPIVFVPALLVTIAVKLTSKGPILYWSDRVGKDNKIFRMPKFRSMRIDAPEVATHLLKDPDIYLTPIGKYLRSSSLDEIPQLWCVLNGVMSFVGPRPALFNQDDLIIMRTEVSVHLIQPGVTGWAQVNGRDELTISEKVDFDREYLMKKSMIFDLKILLLTFVKVAFRQDISH